MATQELYSKWSTAMAVIHPYSFHMETRDLSIDKSIGLFDGKNRATEEQYPVPYGVMVGFREYVTFGGTRKRKRFGLQT